jgi:hypothetical protein
VTEQYPGMDCGAPIGPEAVSDLAEHDGGSDFLLGAVVGCWHLAVGEEDKELAAPSFDLTLQRVTRRVCSGRALLQSFRPDRRPV